MELIKLLFEFSKLIQEDFISSDCSRTVKNILKKWTASIFQIFGSQLKSDLIESVLWYFSNFGTFCETFG